ncbi:MAG: hypothetical protein RQ736_10095 [Thiogranum sp.]|nr:hypothetical protein [Thiogranum sp.]
MPLTKIGFNPATMCQSYLNEKMAQGVSKQQVLNADHVINRSVKFTAVAKCGKSGNSNDHYGSRELMTNMKIICKAGSVAGINEVQMQVPKPPQGPNAFQNQTQVTNVDFKATPRHRATTCPTKVKFNGAITTSGAGTVQYRVLFPGTLKTGTRSMNFAQAGTMNIPEVEYNVTSSIPTATVTLELLSHSGAKTYAKFSVDCIVAEGPGSIQTSPGPNGPPTLMPIKAAPPVAPKPPVIKAVPAPAPKPLPATPAATLIKPAPAIPAVTPVKAAPATPAATLIQAAPVTPSPTPVLRRVQPESDEEPTPEERR